MIKRNKDYDRLSRLFNKRSHAIDTWEKSPTVFNLDNVFKWVRLLSKHVRNMNDKTGQTY